METSFRHGWLITISALAVLAASVLTVGPTRSVIAAVPRVHQVHDSQVGTIQIVSPAPGTMVSTNALTVTVAVRGMRLSCPLAGKPTQLGVGHWHVYLDGQLEDMECTTSHELSLYGLAPGMHNIDVMLATNNHQELMGAGQVARTVFMYQPAQPTVQIVSPISGATVGESFQVQLAWTNFTTSCEQFGRPTVPGVGHWHLAFDSLMGMPTMTMVDMGCAQTDTVYTDGLTPGLHKLYVRLVDNHHMPLMPDAAAYVTINVKK